MNQKKCSPLLCEKLRASSLFQVYQNAFESVTGYHLNLQDEEGDEISLPVPLGKNAPCYLVAEPVHPTVDHPRRGLLQSFAMQLGDEANRAVLQCDGAQPETVRKAIGYLQKNLNQKIQLKEVAEAVGVCTFQLCRLFKKHTGVTMTEYVNRWRVERARQLLRDPRRKISDLLSEVGFTSISQLNRNFRKYSGESPTDYRERLAQLRHCHFQ